MRRAGHHSKFRAAIAILAAIALGTIVYVRFIHPNVAPKRFHTVEPGVLYRSGKLTPAATRKVVENNDIRTIVDLGAWHLGSPEDQLAERTAETLGVRRIRLNGLYGDARGDTSQYLAALRIMTDPDSQPVLVHCGAGTERTGCAVALYEHIVEGVPIDETLRHARRAGHDSHDNPHMPEVLRRIVDPIEAAYRDGTSVPPDL